MQQRVFTVTCAALFAVLSVAEGINWSDQFIKTLMRRRDPATAAKLDQYNSWKNQASMIDRQGGYAEYLKQQKIAEAERKLEAEKRKLLCTPGCHDAANIDMPGFCNEIKRNNECENPAFKYDQCSFTCKGCSKCPPGYTPPTRKPKTTTAPPTTTTEEPTVERSLVDGDNTTELVCTEVEQPCSNRIRWGCGRFYRNCNSKRTKSKCQKYCDLCEKELVCVTVIKEVEEEEETEEEKVEETEEQEEGTQEEGKEEEAEVAEEEVAEQEDEEQTEVAEQEDEEETEVTEQEDDEETENEVAEEDVAEQEDEEEEEVDAGNSTSETEEVEKDGDDTAAVADSPAREKKVDCDPDCIDEIDTCADLIEGKSDFCTDVWNISNKKCKASCKVCLSPCPIET